MANKDSVLSAVDGYLVAFIESRTLRSKLARAQENSIAPLTTCAAKWGGYYCVEDCRQVDLKDPVQTLAVVGWGRADGDAEADHQVVLPCAHAEDCMKVLDFCYVCACEGVSRGHIFSCAFADDIVLE